MPSDDSHRLQVTASIGQEACSGSGVSGGDIPVIICPQALSLLLNYQALPFVIDLACLASRREYLKLDKWLSDKIHEHGEPFIAATVKFLQVSMCVCVGGGGGGVNRDRAWYRGCKVVVFFGTCKVPDCYYTNCTFIILIIIKS